MTSGRHREVSEVGSSQRLFVELCYFLIAEWIGILDVQSIPKILQYCCRAAYLQNTPVKCAWLIESPMIRANVWRKIKPVAATVQPEIESSISRLPFYYFQPQRVRSIPCLCVPYHCQVATRRCCFVAVVHLSFRFSPSSILHLICTLLKYVNLRCVLFRSVYRVCNPNVVPPPQQQHHPTIVVRMIHHQQTAQCLLKFFVCGFICWSFEGEPIGDRSSGLQSFGPAGSP